MEAPSELPPPWISKWSEEQGHLVFYNPETGVTQLITPTEDLPATTVQSQAKFMESGLTDAVSDYTTSPQMSSVPTTSSATESPVICLPQVAKSAIKKGTNDGEKKVSKGKKRKSKQVAVAKKIPRKEEKGEESEAAQKIPRKEEESECSQEVLDEIEDTRREMKQIESQVFRLKEIRSTVQKVSDHRDAIPRVDDSHKLWLVIDTNVLLNDVKVLKTFKALCSSQFQDEFGFLIPWTVIQEIDHIKASFSPKSEDLRNHAKSAAKVIEKWLYADNPSVFGEDPRDAAALFDRRDGFVVENNDDKILHYCMQLHDQYTSCHVAIFTHDTNLRSKCKMAKITAFSQKKLDDWLKAVEPTATPASAHRCFGNHSKTELKVVSIPVPHAVQAATSLAPQECNFFAGTSSVVPATFDSEESTKSTDRVEGQPPGLLGVHSFDSRSPHPVETLDDQDQRRCYDFFDCVLTNLREIKDRVKEELLMSSVFGTSRPMVLRSFIQLHQHVSRIVNSFERVMLAYKAVGISPCYLDLLSAVSAFRDEFNLKFPSVDCREVHLFFEDASKREMLTKGLAQFKEIESAVIDTRRLLTPAECWCLFERI